LDQVIYDDSFDSTQVNLLYDAAGNLIDDGIYLYKYDAWNRLVEVQRKAATGDPQTIAVYGYDGLGRRIRKVVTHSGDRNRSERFYHDYRWRLLEVRDETDQADRQFVWGATYIDEAVCTDVDTDDDGDCLDFDDTQSNPEGGAERYFYLQDANCNVIALRQGSDIVERYEYDPYGNVRIFAGYDPLEGREDLTFIGDGLVGSATDYESRSNPPCGHA